jgi:hypothetical protein
VCVPAPAQLETHKDDTNKATGGCLTVRLLRLDLQVPSPILALQLSNYVLQSLR